MPYDHELGARDKGEKVDFCSLGGEAALLRRYIEGKEKATLFLNLVN
jgi:hypothetical protein